MLKNVAKLMTCPQGHRWTGDESACPVCGHPSRIEPGESTLSSPAMSIDISADPTQLSPAQTQLGSFVIVRPHARGGLGLVSVARDQSLGREVALKQIRADLADDVRCRHRFINEAEITGQLEHPGIVPVYALGHDSDGRPFYAMKFVHGRTMAEAIAEHHAAPTNQSFRDLLRRFVSVCQAIAYAHSRGVIHRDLKPSNIMLGEFGEQLILDWGLAKKIGSDSPSEAASNAGASIDKGSSAVTLDGQVIGTPLYMSPEQARGDVAQQSAASDIYALGAILYHILTGKPALHGRTNEQIVTSLKAGESLPRPSAIDRSVDRALEAICLKAMAPRPQDRYATAEALAGDIERWQADEPVTAYREPLAARLSRLTRRHRSIVAGGAAVILVLSLGVIATTFQSIRATRAEALATQQRDLAQQRFSDVRTLANKFMLDFHAQIENLPGSTPAVKMLVQTSLDYLNKLEPQAGGDRSLLAEIALAYQKVGDIQGSPVGANLGDTKGAIDSYRKAQALLDSLATTGAPDDKLLRSRAIINARLGDMRTRDGDIAAALAAFKQSHQVFEKLAAAAPDDFAVARDLAVSYVKVGSAQYQLGDTSTALADYDKAAAVWQNLIEARPDDNTARRDYSVIRARSADILMQRGEYTRALAIYQSCLSQRQELVKRDANNSVFQRDLAGGYERVASAQAALGDSAAMDGFKQALALREKIAAADPQNVQTRTELRITLEQFGAALMREGKLAEAETYLQRNLSMAREMAEADPESAQYQRYLAVTLSNFGELMSNKGDSDAALAHYRQSLSILSRIASAGTLTAHLLRDLCIVEARLGDVLAAQRDFATAATHQRNSAEWAAQWSAIDPQNVEALTEWSTSLSSLAESSAELARQTDLPANVRAAHWNDTREAARRALEIFDRLAGDSVPSPIEHSSADAMRELIKESDRALAAPPATRPGES